MAMQGHVEHCVILLKDMLCPCNQAAWQSQGLHAKADCTMKLLRLLTELMNIKQPRTIAMMDIPV